MYLSDNYVDTNIYPLTLNVMRLWSCLHGKGTISNDKIDINFIIITIIIIVIIIIIIIIIIINRCQHTKAFCISTQMWSWIELRYNVP